MTTNRFLWFITILSALAYSAAFLGPEWCGWLAVPAISLLCWHRVTVRQGFAWGVLAFGLHSLWMLQVLLTHTSCSVWLCCLLFMLPMLLCGLVAAGWWGAMTAVGAGVGPRLVPVARATTTVMVWWLMCSVYPFINPFIPLAQYRWFLRTLALVFGLMHGYTLPPSLPALLNESIGYIRPVINRAMGVAPAWAYDPYAVGQRLNEQIQKSTKPLLVAPESTYPFSLIDHENIAKSFCNGRNEQQVVLMGSSIKKTDGIRHVVYCLQRGLIIDFYVKRMLLPFAEQTPSWLASITPFLQRISCGAWADARPGTVAEGVDLFDVGLPFVVCPRICWEFFACPLKSFVTLAKRAPQDERLKAGCPVLWQGDDQSQAKQAARPEERSYDGAQILRDARLCSSNYDVAPQDERSVVDYAKKHKFARPEEPPKLQRRGCHEGYERTTVLFAFINDSWFTTYARKNMLLAAILKSHSNQRLVVYIGHFGCYTINPYTSTITSLRS